VQALGEVSRELRLRRRRLRASVYVAAIRVMSKLVLFLADGKTLDIPLRRERMTVGRRADNDICLPNLAVSGEHAAIVTILADSFLEDLGSTNGTLVNGTAIAKHFLRDGDQIDVGRHLLVYCVDDDAVLSADYVRSAPRAAAGDLGDRVESAVIRDPAAAGGSAMRRDRAARNAAAARSEEAEVDAVPPQKPLADADIQVPAATTPVPEIERTAVSRAPMQATASLKVLSGSGTGRMLPLRGDRLTLGRAGVQVVEVARVGGRWTLKCLEGARPLKVNGQAAPSDLVSFALGDVVEIAGRRLELVELPPVG
jgi:hypothetical protein